MCTSRCGDVDYLQGGFFLEEQAQFLSCVSVTGWSLGSKTLSTIRTPRRCAMQWPRKRLAVLIIETVVHFISFPKVQIWVACWHIQLTEAVGTTAPSFSIPSVAEEVSLSYGGTREGPGVGWAADYCCYRGKKPPTTRVQNSWSALGSAPTTFTILASLGLCLCPLGLHSHGTHAGTRDHFYSV